ncbi:MAG TPA: hypothetical protein VJA26_08990 [Gammaproteobacteria bacterium]|nr:hypothetical protein [Gammaproteobacteria bacterium]
MNRHETSETPVQDSDDATTQGLAERLNQQCFCVTVDRAALNASLQSQLGEAEAAQLRGADILGRFSESPVFVPEADIARMERIVRAVGAAAVLPAFRDAVLSWAPAIAGADPGPIGAFMGYDFHVGSRGPRLIEVNTNAGGAFINARLGRAHRACCSETQQSTRTIDELDRFERAVVSMFEAEWVRQRGDGRPRRMAIVDDRPEMQYMYPEFRFAQAVLQRHGIETLVADAADLAFANGELLAAGKRIDLVYNRLVDFALDAPEHAALRAAYVAGAVVVTPNPHVHALLADKRNFTLLSDSARLRQWGLPESDVQALEAAVPKTVLVTPEIADALWQARKDLFFKPAAGHGSKGVYRGSKITRKVFAQVVGGGYVAQSYVPPSERLTRIDDLTVALKVDVRLYTYDSETLLTAARIYRGQATNFRTPGGGFAPVFRV